ncbi:MAG: lipopolysaccharide biosynthesis protein [Candidatus Thorarchaeota archaeon]
MSFRLISRIIIARFASIDVYGIYSIIWSETNFFSIIALLGLGQQLTIDLPRNKLQHQTDLVFSSVLYAIVIGLISGIFSIFFHYTGDINTIKYSLFVSIFFILYLLFQFVFIGLKDFFGFFLLSLFQNLFFFTFVVVFKDKLNPEILVLLLIISILFSILISICYLGKIQNFNFLHLRKYNFSIFKFNKRRFYLFSSDIVNALILYLILKLPQIYIGTTLSAYISAAYSLIVIFLLPSQMISAVMAPLLSEQFERGSAEDMNTTLRFSVSLILLFQGFTTICIFYFGGYFLEIIYGQIYFTNSYLFLIGFMYSSIIDSLNYPFKFYIRNTNHESLFAKGKWISLIIFILILFVIFFSAIEKGISIIIAYIGFIVSQFSIYFLFTWKYNKKMKTSDIYKVLKWMVLTFILITVSFAIPMSNSALISRIVLFILSECVFVTLIHFTRIFNMKFFLREIKNLSNITKN